MNKLLSAISYCRFFPDQLNTFVEQIKKATKIVLLPHAGADGDALGSCAAMQIFLQEHAKQAEIVCMDKPKGVWLPVNYVINEPSFVPDLIISLDTANKERCFFLPSWESVYWINIDHHRSNTNYGHLNLVEPTASSAAEVLAMILWQTFGEQAVSPAVAKCLMYSLLDDTQSFRVPSMHNDTLLVAHLLDQAGGQLKDTKRQMIMNHRLAKQQYIKWQNIIAHGQFMFDDQVLLLPIDLDLVDQLNLCDSDTNGLINYVMFLLKVDLVVLLTQISPELIKVSTRSNNFDAGSLCQHFGGGGHFNAAGAKLIGYSMEQALQSVIDYIEQNSFD